MGRRLEKRMNIFLVVEGEFDCSKCDGMLFADGELFCNLPFYTEGRASSPSLCTPQYTARLPSTRVGAKRSGVPTCHSVTARQQGEKKNKYVVSVITG